MPRRLHIVSLVLGLCLALGSTTVHAQLMVEPLDLNVAVEQETTATRSVTLTNAGEEPLTFCVTFDRPLQRRSPVLRLSEQATGELPCGTYGEVLYYFDEDDLGSGWGPSGVVMTPEGRLFTTELSALHRTFEFTPDLTLVRSFENPTVAELTPFAGTIGIGYDTESGTLWWMNLERENGSGSRTRRVLLLEGDLTGRRIEIAPPDDPIDDFSPGGLAYDPSTDHFLFSAVLGDGENRDNWQFWAVDRDGTVPEGYPVRPEPYPDGIFNIIDAHGGAEGGPDGVRIEYGVYPPGALGFSRIAVVDRWGNDEGEELETPVPPVLLEAGGAGPRGNPLRSRIDPNGMMYMTFNNFNHRGIVGVRPHPLPPSWLVVNSDAGSEGAWDGTLAPGASREIALTFRAGARAVGDYTSALQAFVAATGEAVEVPLSLTVTQGTGAEDAGAEPAVSSLSVYPNPARASATVALTLDAAANARVVVYDVLGRAVAMLADGALGAGTHELMLDGRGLPVGVYVVRVVGDGLALTHRLTLLR
ncbi:MAG: T9SS type A sorting domain-containing protein [Rhodothermales bacterium]